MAPAFYAHHLFYGHLSLTCTTFSPLRLQVQPAGWDINWRAVADFARTTDLTGRSNRIVSQWNAPGLGIADHVQRAPGDGRVVYTNRPGLPVTADGPHPAECARTYYVFHPSCRRAAPPTGHRAAFYHSTDATGGRVVWLAASAIRRHSTSALVMDRVNTPIWLGRKLPLVFQY